MGFGFAFPLFYLSLLYLSISLLVENPYQFNPDYTIIDFFKSSFFVLKGVIFEELLFRGALFYLLIRQLGTNKAIAISAIAFGIFHWFSYGIIGQPLKMLTVFISTGIMGYLLALAFVKSSTILLPLIIHLGYNFCSMILFSKEKTIGSQLLVKTYHTDPVKPEGIVPLMMVVVYYLGFPVLCYCYLRLIKPACTDLSKFKKPFVESVFQTNISRRKNGSIILYAIK
ncbi:CPBP family intramembrane glutamic endopeptidase [Pedobacter polysacchareus]|uniref:CPBP family intramembrane glutamic endopeptidase n=1 Tax=Pedobacter polysacchareus TaxID=2861973 RepID=UPI001C9975E3|nr:CPBP family intramembrane glutamic endopeptidase [Pedobacter polysacchareus]